MRNTKFKLLKNDTIEVWGKTLYRIEALKDFSHVSKGEKGGYIEKERNLDVLGNAWVSGNALVSGDAWISGNAQVSGDAQVLDNVWMADNALVSGYVQVSGDARVGGNAQVSGNALISGDTLVVGDARVGGDALILGDALVSGNARISGNAEINDASELLVIGPIGSESGHLTAFKNKDKTISVTRGCFAGTLKEFEMKVEETHGDNEYGKTYRIAIELIKNKLGNNKEGEAE